MSTLDVITLIVIMAVGLVGLVGAWRFGRALPGRRRSDRR
jgi:hypothetical protein